MTTRSLADSSPAGWADRPLLPPLCALTLAGAVLVNAMDVGDSARPGGETVGFSGQVAVKLLVAAMASVLGGWGLWHSRRLRNAMASGPGLLLWLLAATLVATSTVALPETAQVSRIASLIFVGYVAFVPMAVDVLGLRRAAVSVLSGLVLFLLGSWFLYLLVPSLGVFVEQLGAGQEVIRMGGLGHPNALARAAMLAVLLATVLMRQSRAGRGLLVLVVLLAVLTAAATLSRTAIVAGVVAFFVLLSDLLRTRRAVLGGLAVAVALLGGFIALRLAQPGDPLARLLVQVGTKTGDIEELTTATGRTEIWQAAWSLIQQRPLTGYGLGSAPVLLQDYSQHTHNILLHPLLSAGVVAGGLVSLLLLWNLVLVARSNEPLVRSVLAFVLVAGLFEDTLLDTFPGPPTVLWILATLYPVPGMASAAARSPAPDVAGGDNAREPVEGTGTGGYTTAVS